MEQIRKNIRRVFWLYFALFMVLAVYLAKFVIFDSREIVASQFNPRLRMQRDFVIRGDILDSRGNRLAYTNIDYNRRIYPLGYAAAHAVGYFSAGAAGFYGVEARHGFDLQNVSGEIRQRLNHVMHGSTIMGDSIVLTINSDAQSFIYNQLQHYRAGAIVLEPSTGKIIAMVSTPSFNPNNLAENADNYLTDNYNNPLFNRATQGSYPPGSVYKIVTAAAALELLDYRNFVFNCVGEDLIGGRSIRCANYTVHGEVDLFSAFAYSCNIFFSYVGVQVGAAELISMSERLYFNAPLPFPLENSNSSFPLEETADGIEIVDTSIGQGRIMTSPLQIALITSAVANNGVIMTPYIFDHIRTYDGRTIRKTVPVMSSHVFSPEVSDALREMMVEVTSYGTGTPVAIYPISIAAKTGSAQTPTGIEHGWYTAFFPADDPQFVLCVVVENVGGSSQILAYMRNIIEYLTNL